MQSKVFLSILIPLYNWDVSALLRELEKQAEEFSGRCPIEIRVVDDGSSEDYGIRSLVEQMHLVSYTKLPKNRGRSAARNQLLQQAGGEYVLFLDADMLPDDSSFLRNYLDHAENGEDIVCGGISYRQVALDDDRYSFYLYKSSRTESLTAEKRNRAPWKYLFTSNILMRKSIADSISFDSAFTGYGFEDIEWGIRLSRLYTISHIDNTCTHSGVMTKENTFSRMRQSVNNFALLLALHPRETQGAAAARVSLLLMKLPPGLLAFFDGILKKAFRRLGWNPLLFALFQADKMVLLARERKFLNSNNLLTRK